MLLIAVMVPGCGKGTEPETFRVGILTNSTQNADTIAGIMAALGEGGLVEGSNLTVVYDGPVATDMLDTAASALLDGGVDLIFAVTTQPAVIAKEATRETGVPVVFGPASDPVAAGIVDSLPSPGGNVTGVVTAFFPGKVFEYLLAIQPETRRVLVLNVPGDQVAVASLELIRSVAGPMGIELEVRDVSTAADIAALMDDLPAGVDAIFPSQSVVLTNNAGLVVAGAISHRIPLVSGQMLTPQGALLSYGFKRDSLGEQMGRLAVLILVDGTQPSQIPVEAAELYLTINLATAEAIGLTVPGEVIQQADEVYREAPPPEQG